MTGGPAPDRASLLYALRSSRGEAKAGETLTRERALAASALTGFAYRPRPKKTPETLRPEAAETTWVATSSTPSAVPTSDIRFEPVTFWRPVEREYREDLDGNELPGPEPVATRSVTREDLEIPDDVLPPAHVPIAPWPRLWRTLEDHLRTERPRRLVDAEALLRRWSRGESVRELPRLEGLAHAPLTVIIDSSQRLLPFWNDQMQVVGRLIRRLGVYAVRLVDGGVALAQGLPDFGAEERVLALTDLGVYGKAQTRVAWARLGRQLSRRLASPPVALVPVGSQRLANTAGSWKTLEWREDGRPEGLLSDSEAERQSSTSAAVLDDVLTLASMAQRLDLGLLRQLRRLVPGADLETEVAFFRHPIVEQTSPRGVILNADEARKRRVTFLELPSDLQRRAVAILEDWRRGQARETLALEVYELLGCGVSEALFSQDVLDSSRELIASLAHRVTHQSPDDKAAMAVDLDAWYSRLHRFASGGLWLHTDLKADLEQASKAHRKRHPEAPEAPSSTSEMLARPEEKKEPRHTIDIYQGPSGFMTKREAGGSFVVSLASRGSGVTLVDPAGQPRELGDDPALAPKPSMDRAIVVATDAESVRLEPWRPVLEDPTAWCTDAGRDRYGLWAALEIGDVEARMRWIPPGRFRMGSPESEEGRDYDEVLHEVVLTEGFWLAETACTQAQWEAAMGSNPSEHSGVAERPVETVSWEDSQDFLEEMNSRYRYLELRLPTEAEWEFACRASTSTATWLGNPEIDPDGDNRWLREIAWFGGESQGPQPVGEKMPSPWGLYDVLGNVDEWCWDWGAPLDSRLARNPEGPGEGSSRVLRGGVWDDRAHRIRAAARLWSHPADRDSDLGFRWSRGRVSVRGAEKEPGRAAFGSAARGTSRPDRSRRDRAWIERLGWAHDGGVDQYGRWTSVRVGNVEARLRWICPGAFLMGSPESEEGRFHDEGPQHEVTLSEGFWLAEVPCTQDLWLEVMGSNPSQFQSPGRPVENVSWEDVQEFLGSFESRVPGLGPRLPTDAQWEFACRAGATQATWLGDLEILGERNAPILDSIAWYGGNSGAGFDLAVGHDSSDWEEKQFPHRRAGTRVVGLKRRNPWGLQDMLGNVFEWCQDWHGAYVNEAQDDPEGPSEGSNRVFRGGSWGAHARDVRAASRGWLHPGLRGSYLGFRWSRGRE